MNIKVSRIEIIPADIPFKTGFKHASKKRDTSESVFVRLETNNGEVGFGESLPRPYVTGEDQKSVTIKLQKVLPEVLLGKTFNSFEEAVEFSGSLKELTGAAKCAFELALLDCIAKAFNSSVSKALSGIKTKCLRYSAAIGEDSARKAKMSALKFRLYGIKDVKLKVGDECDIERLKTVRRFLGF